MTAPALLKTEDLRRAAKVAAETGVEITIEIEGRKVTIRPPDPTTMRKLDYQPDFRL